MYAVIDVGYWDHFPVGTGCNVVAPLHNSAKGNTGGFNQIELMFANVSRATSW